MIPSEEIANRRSPISNPMQLSSYSGTSGTLNVIAKICDGRLTFFPDFIRSLTIRNEGTVDGLMEVLCTDGNWHEVKVGDTVVQEVDSLGNMRVYIK